MAEALGTGYSELRWHSAERTVGAWSCGMFLQRILPKSGHGIEVAVSTTIEPFAERHFEQLHWVTDQVARERRYLAMLQAPPVDQSYTFYREVLASGQCHVAVNEGKVVGWCDVTPEFGKSRRHVGALGMGDCRRSGVALDQDS